MSNTTIVLLVASGAVAFIMLFVVLFEIRNHLGVKKRKPEDTTIRSRPRDYQQLRVLNCNSCPCYRNWCGPTCGLDHTLYYPPDCDYVYTAHPGCPLLTKHYLLQYKGPDPAGEP